MRPLIRDLPPKVYPRVSVEQEVPIKPMEDDDWSKRLKLISVMGWLEINQLLQEPLFEFHRQHFLSQLRNVQEICAFRCLDMWMFAPKAI